MGSLPKEGPDKVAAVSVGLGCLALALEGIVLLNLVSAHEIELCGAAFLLAAAGFWLGFRGRKKTARRNGVFGIILNTTALAILFLVCFG